MPTASKPITLGIKGSTLSGKAVFTNLTRSGKATVAIASNEGLTSASNWEVGDKVSVQVIGKYNSSVEVTIPAKGGILKDFGSLTEDTNTPAVSL